MNKKKKEITKNTLLYLNETFYFDKDGIDYTSRKEARECYGLYGDDILTIRKQYCYAKRWEEMNEDEKEIAKFLIVKQCDTQWEEYIYLWGASLNGLLLRIPKKVFKNYLENGTLTIGKKPKVVQRKCIDFNAFNSVEELNEALAPKKPKRIRRKK